MPTQAAAADFAPAGTYGVGVGANGRKRSGSRPPSNRPVGMRLGTNRDRRERERGAIQPLHGERLPRGTPSACAGDTSALVHTGKMPGLGSGFLEKDAFLAAFLRITEPTGRFRVSDFGFLSVFGLRASDFPPVRFVVPSGRKCQAAAGRSGLGFPPSGFGFLSDFGHRIWDLAAFL